MIEDMKDTQRQSDQTPGKVELIRKKNPLTPMTSQFRILGSVRFFLQHSNNIAAQSAKKRSRRIRIKRARMTNGPTATVGLMTLVPLVTLSHFSWRKRRSGGTFIR
jgi:hypothetical protein